MESNRSEANTRVSIIGTGHVAHQLGEALHTAGVAIVEIVGRNRSDGTALATVLSSTFQSSIAKMKTTNVIIIAVSDDAIQAVSDAIPISLSQAAFILHTSGSVSSDVLSRHKRSAVAWPLQTIKRQSQFDWSAVPFIITTSADANFQLLDKLFSKVSKKIVRMSDEDRSKLHVPAVIVNNFTTYLYGVAADICEREEIEFELLLPLIRETTDRLIGGINPIDQLTGPAKRKDVSTIERHKKVLADNEGHLSIYNFISERIIALKDDIDPSQQNKDQNENS